MKKNLKILFVIIAVLSHSCSVFVGTKTLYTARNIEKINTWGYTNLENDNTLSTIYPRTHAVFTSTIVETFAKHSLEAPTEVSANLSFENPDIVQIISICEENNLDGLLLSKLTFVNVTYYINFVPVFDNIDTEVEMKLFTKEGKVVAITRHNTHKGSDYMMPPTTERTIHDATARALKKIIKIVNKK
ncbi:MAG: hypothetical protein FWC34_06660 [Bacteroidetes bacterium]|nr:hypothetical protein [Bacteroidota bacterium]MCL2301754.1 hypothetical protein [Lentimicrobiaceae bacterium]